MNGATADGRTGAGTPGTAGAGPGAGATVRRVLCGLAGGALWLAAAPCPGQWPDAGLVLWLKADSGVIHDAAGRVSRWEDQSGAGNHFAEPDPACQPTIGEALAHGRPALRFDGVDDALTLTAAPLPVAGRTVFAVVRWNAARTYSFAIGCAEGTDGYLRLHSATALLTGGRYPVLHQNGVAFAKVGYTPGDGRRIFHNGLDNLLQWNIYAVAETPDAAERLRHLGRNEQNNTPENRFQGEIAEILVFDRVLAAAERAQVEQSLGMKYLGWPPAPPVPVRADPVGSVTDDGAPGPAPDTGTDVLAHGLTAAPLGPGRYRVHFRVRAATPEPHAVVVRLGGDLRRLPVHARAEAWTDCAADFVLPLGQAPDAALVRVSRDGAVTAPAVTGLRVEPLAPVTVQKVAVDKILYAPGQEATGSVSLRNDAAAAQAVEVRWSEVTGLDDRRFLGTQTSELPPGGEATLTLGYNVGPVEYGRELLVEVWQAGRRLDMRGEPYSVADSVWKVALGSPSGGPISGTAPHSRETIARQLHAARNAYCNWFEKSFWAPDDWGVLTTPPGATWFSGQARRHESSEKLQYQIQVAHDLGMKAITYGKCMAGGVPGWELARRRPQWFVVDAYGRTRGRPADVWDLDHWQQADQYAYADYRYAWTYRWVDLRLLEPLDHGIDQLIASTRQFGWDGVRFDSGGFRAHYVPKDGTVLFDGVDSYNARNTRRMKERIWQECPGFLFGYNTNDPVCQAATGAVSPLTPADPAGHEFREMMAGGGLWMFEGMRDKPDFWGRRTYKSWSDYATDMVQAIRTIRSYGGHVCFSYGDTSLYKFTIGTMIGAHDYVGEHLRAPGSENWGRFLTRWSSLVWDHRLRALPDADAVTVTAPRPLWWQGFANELVLSPTRRCVVVHLLNPPVNDECAQTKDEVPEPVTGIQVAFAHPAQRLVRARFIAPGTPNRAEPVAPQTGSAPDVSRLAVPRLDVWGMLVLELEGTYIPAQNPPAFTEPLSAAEQAELEACRPTLNVPLADDLRNPTPQFDPATAPVKEFGAPRVAMPAGLRVGGAPGRDVLVVNGFYHGSYRVPEALAACASDTRVTTCTTRDLPREYADLFRYDVIVLVNLGADAWDADGHRRLADFVEAGGRLLVLGGPFTLGQGFFRGTALERVLPVEVRQARDVYQLPEPLSLGSTADAPFPGRPLVYFFHAVAPRPDAKARLWAGPLPVAWDWTVGRGTACVFTGTTMGEALAAEQQPFWSWDGWPAVLGALITGTER